MPEAKPTFRQEYRAFWSNRPRVRLYLLLLSPNFIAPLVRVVLHQKDAWPLVDTLWLLALDIGLAFGGVALVVANDRLKRRQQRPAGPIQAGSVPDDGEE